jgi:hypothetical protein
MLADTHSTGRSTSHRSKSSECAQIAKPAKSSLRRVGHPAPILIHKPICHAPAVAVAVPMRVMRPKLPGNLLADELVIGLPRLK